MSTESDVGRAYFEILEAIKDQLANEIYHTSIELSLPSETIKTIIQKAKAVVDKNYDRGAATLIKSL